MNHHAASDPLVSCSALNFVRLFAIPSESERILNRRLLAGIKVGIAAFPFDAKVKNVVCGA
ncbi:MAG: uncharacterized protein KVP18_002006 [Porospora cf. gigantea A]|uniref:uncharacterized protein n=1 Tax=Porospora cf. gigantea A TaxID=2853593 RepID=UPI00355A592A|nr:MAG: hypothetical protein KVP18_002006 [Porospora cf. gigantea A]